MAEFEGLLLLHLWEEVERREVQRNINLRQRHLRDIANPFEIPEPLFIQFFRLPKDVTRNLVNDISPHLPIIYRRDAIPAYLKVLVALNFYAMGSYQKNVGQTMVTASMSQPSVSRCIKEVSQVIVDHLVQTWIKFPTEEEEVRHAKEQFLQHFQMPGVIGCINATHIAIVSPSVEDPIYPALVYYNRKGFYSLNVQIISDAELRIRSIHAGYPGSTHDSAIKRHLHQRFDLHNTREWLLGDAGYPLQPFLLTPMLNVPDDTAEGRYIHSSTFKNTQ